MRDFLAHSGSPNDNDRCFALACVALDGTGPPARCGQTQNCESREPQ
jgi:hypothetical protein